MIKVLIADSCAADVNMLMEMLDTDPEIEAVGVATTGKETMEMALELRPDIIIMSESPRNGDDLEAIKHIMAYNPTPILILTAPSSGDRKSEIFKAASMGVLDIIEKSTLMTDSGLHGNTCDIAKTAEFVRKIGSLSKVEVVTHIAGKLENIRRSMSIQNSHYDLPQDGNSKPNKVVAIAASTGGPSALAKVLRGLPAESAMSVVIVQHVAEGFTAGLAEWLDRESGMSVREAQDGDGILAGYVSIAPTGHHMLAVDGGRIALNETPPVAGYRPSADILFASVAEIYGHDSIGVVLTGMGSDGAKGIAAIKNAGGKTIAQDKQNCVIFGMPEAAIQTGAVDKIVPLDSIAEKIIQICGETPS